MNGFVADDFELGDLVVGPAPDESLYLAHTDAGRVLKIDRRVNPPVVSVIVDGLTSPRGLAFDDDGLLITDDVDNVVFRIVPDAANASRF